MKLETLIYDKVRNIIPDRSEKTIFFVAVGETSYEVFFYARIDGEVYQCFELAEQEKLDENELDVVFAEVVNVIRKSTAYSLSNKNIVTIEVDETGIQMNVDYVDKDARMYGIKKEWERMNISKLQGERRL